MSPRLMQVLLRRFVEQRTRAEFATLYGLSLEHADLLVWKAARSFEAALAGRDEPGPLPFEQEQASASAMVEANPVPITQLVEQREPLQRALHQAALEAEASPARAREEWLRRIAIAVVLALASYFYWRDHYAPKERRFEPRPSTLSVPP